MKVIMRLPKILAGLRGKWEHNGYKVEDRHTYNGDVINARVHLLDAWTFLLAPRQFHLQRNWMYEMCKVN